MKIDPVVFSSTDNTGSNKSIKSICENARISPWKASHDYRTVEEFLIEFENEIRQLVRTNKEYNMAFSEFLQGTELFNFKKAMKSDDPWHQNAIKLVKQFSTIMTHQRDIREFMEDKKKPQQSVVDFATFWMRRMRWNTSVTAKWIAQVLLEKIGDKYREIFKECMMTDTVEDIIQKIDEMENSGTANLKKIDASMYYHQVAKPLMDQTKQSTKTSTVPPSSKNDSYLNSNKPSGSNSKPETSKKPFARFDKGQLFRRQDRDGKAKFTKVSNINEVNLNEEGVSICYVDSNHDIQEYDKENPPKFDEFEVCDIELLIDALNFQ